MRFKRLIGFVLAVIIIMSLFSVGVSADIGDNIIAECEPNYDYDIADPIYADDTVVGCISTNDVDMFEFYLSQPSDVEIFCAADFIALSILIYDEYGEVVALADEDYEAGYGIDTYFEMLHAGTYYLALFNYKFDFDNDYVLYFNYAVGSWQQDNVGWWYRTSDGDYLVDGWALINDVWYYFDEYGYILTGWQQIGDTWYHFNNGGAMQTGWINYGGTWYYLDDSGAMQTGWQQIGGTWYYLNGSGVMQTGWLNFGGTWYYLNSGGAMLTGWHMIGDSWYYFYANGSMATNCWIGNYWITSSGAMA